MKKQPFKVQRAGAYVVKAAESPSTRVNAKTSVAGRTPSAGDKRLARAVMRHKSSS